LGKNDDRAQTTQTGGEDTLGHGNTPGWQATSRGEAVKKWDWLRQETAKTLENQRSRRCLSQFIHSLGAASRVGGEIFLTSSQQL
jgi:hypothetical protein